MNKHKFKVGDLVKVVKTGSGFGDFAMGNIYKIIDCGSYRPEQGILGYKVTDLKGNLKINNFFHDFVGEDSFRIHEDDLDTLLNKLENQILKKENE